MSFTLSLSSTTSSVLAAKAKVFSVSPLLNATLAGTPEKSAAVAPSWPVQSKGMATVRLGSSLRMTVTSASFSVASGVSGSSSSFTE